MKANISLKRAACPSPDLLLSLFAIAVTVCLPAVHVLAVTSLSAGLVVSKGLAVSDGREEWLGWVQVFFRHVSHYQYLSQTGDAVC